MAVSKAALREGVLHDMVGRSRDEDPRDASVAALMKCYGIDIDQALRVERTALHLFDQVATALQLGPDERLMLGWAARLHAGGLVSADSQHNVTGDHDMEHPPNPAPATPARH